MGYIIDLSAITIDSYKKMLESRYLIPSQRILKDNIDKRFSYFERNGIRNVNELFKMLKEKDKTSEISKLNIFSEDYLSIMLRQIKGMLAKPRKLNDFHWISDATIKKLHKSGIKNTEQLYETVISHKSISEFVNTYSLDVVEMMILIKQTDLTRIQWVNHTFSRVLYEAGYDTVRKVQKANYEIMYKEITELNKEKELYKGNIGLNDMKLLVEVSVDVEPEINY